MQSVSNFSFKFDSSFTCPTVSNTNFTI